MESFINVDTLYYSMFVEKRKIRNLVKYYLVHSYREKSKVKKIRRYLGSNLSKNELEKAKKNSENEIKRELEALNTDIFNFSLTKNQVEKLNKYDIKIHHFQHWEWKRFKEQFTYNTNAIEGSSVELKEVPEILKGKAIDSEEKETKGVAKAVDFIGDTKVEFSLELIKKLHKLCFAGSKDFAGSFRAVEVAIRNSRGDILHRGVPVSELKEALDDLVGWYNRNKNKFKPLALAAILHNQFEHIHPFTDGNGRVGRLLLNYILIKNNCPPINILLKDRAEYYQALQEYHKHNSLTPMLKFLIKQYKKTLKQVTTKSKK